MKAMVLAALMWTLVAGDTCSTKITVALSSGTNCSQAEWTSPITSANLSECNDLQPVLQYVASLGLATELSSCIQVDIFPGTYVVETALVIQQNLRLSGTGPGVVVSFNITADNPDTPFYVLVFQSSNSVSLNDINFTRSQGLFGFENVTTVTITGSSFSYFLQGAVDIYNCGYPTVTNCTFAHNGPTYIIKRQRYRGHSGGLSIGYNLDAVVGYNPQVLVANSSFINNSVMTRLTAATQVLQNRIFAGRGGGASIIINAADSVRALVEDCYFAENSALTLGGGLYTIPDGPLTGHNVIVNRTKFVKNHSFGGGGGLQLVYIDPGSLSRLLSVMAYNCEFIGNTATIGGAIYVFLTGYVPIVGEVGNYAHFENCFFQGNVASRFGAAIAVSSGLVFGNRERISAMDVVNCTFRSNFGLNKAGILSTAYFAVALSGVNQFISNAGSALTIVGSVVHLSENSVLQILNTTNSVDGSAMSFVSLGQVVLYTNSNIYFLNNVGSLGASVAVENLRYLPIGFQQVLYNPICLFRHNHFQESPLRWGYENISIVFDSNSATVGAAIYTSNAAVCSWLRLSEPFFNTTEFYRTPALKYRNNRNIAHAPQDYATKWDVQTKPVALSVQNINQSIEAYPGEKFTLKVAANDEFNFSTVSVVKLIDSIKETSSTSKFSFSQSATVIDNLSSAAFQTSFATLSNVQLEEDFEVVTLFTTFQYSSTFTISSLPCPPGTVLVKLATSFYTCQCNVRDPYITECRGSKIILQNGYWASTSSSTNYDGGTIQAYICPAGYCRCTVNSGSCEFSTDFETSREQCSCLRSGVLCGDCDLGYGVSALLNRCVTCSDGSGVLIALLVVSVALVFLGLMLLSINFPSWLLPCSFYIQLLPFVTEHYPVTFEIIRPYLYYVSSGLSFYFVYDFCLYSTMSPLVSYFIRYLPLFTAVIVCPITLAIMNWWSPHKKWHGLWWIVVLMYTHLVHTSMSILNCPRIDGNSANVWYINGNIECFTGWHIPLALLAILVLILCIACIPLIWLVARKSNVLPRWTLNSVRCLIPALAAGYKEDVKWFGCVELFRRLITVLFIVALPGNEYSSIFLIIIIITIYGYVQPYKFILSNVLEIAIAADVLVLLLMKNTNQIRDTLGVIPNQESANNTLTCTDNDNIEGLSPLVKLFIALYYLPVLILLLRGGVWAVNKLSLLITKSKNIHKPSKGKGVIYNLLYYEEAPEDPANLNSIELNAYDYVLPQEGQSLTFTTPYIQQEPFYIYSNK